MKSRKSFYRFFSCIALLFVASFAGCKDLELDSEWRDRAITIDGAAAEWRNALTYDEETKTSVGVVNDEEYVYLCLTSVDRVAATRMAGLGFTVWFDPEGRKEKTFGIHFPLGMLESGRPMDSRKSMRDSKEFQKLFEDLGSEIEILGPGKGQRIRESLVSTGGIEVKMAYSKGNLVYELKVPLNESEAHLYAIGAGAGKTIGIGFETSELDREQMREMMSQRGSGTGGRGGKGGMGQRGGRGGMRQGGGMPEPFELWTKVKLASKSSSVGDSVPRD